MIASLPDWYLHLFAFVFGALVGSFLNVVIARVPKGLSIVRPRSFCPSCRTPIRARDNVPILSWLLLRGRCRSCGVRISPRYPFVELAVALLAVAVLRRFGPTPWALAAFAFVAALVALTYIDLDHWLLPRSITIPFIALGLGASFLPGGPGIASAAMGAAVGFGAFVLLGWLAERILKKEALGGGDVWLLAMIGAWLGLRSLLPVVLLASVQGALVGGILLLATRRHRKTAMPPPRPTGDPEVDEWEPPEGAVPFGPFLALGAAEYLFFGERLVDWYLGLLTGS